MAIKKESLEIESKSLDNDQLDQIKKEIYAEALKAFKEEAEKERILKEQAEAAKTLYGYNVTLTYMNYYAVNKVAEFLINDERFLVPEGEPTDVSLAVCEILDEHLEKNKANQSCIMYKYVKNNKIFR